MEETAMTKTLILFLTIPILLAGCSSKKNDFEIKQGTPAYQLAKDLASTLPELDPDLKTVLIRTNTFDITTSEVIKFILENSGNQASQLKTIDAARLKNTIVQNAQRLAETKILLAAAEDAKNSVSPDDVEEALQPQYQRYGGEDGFLSLLTKEGIDIEHIKENVKNDLLIQRYLEKHMANQGAVSEEEIQAVYQVDKTASVRHILLLTQEKTDAEKLEIHKKMEEIVTRAKNGEDFTALAKEYSEDPGSKDRGGLYEDFGRGAMVKPFEEAAFTVPVGEISDIVETNYGYHILQIVNRKPETRPLEEVRAELEEQILKSKQGEIYTSEIKKLKEKAGYEEIVF